MPAMPTYFHLQIVENSRNNYPTIVVFFLYCDIMEKISCFANASTSIIPYSFLIFGVNKQTVQRGHFLSPVPKNELSLYYRVSLFIDFSPLFHKENWKWKMSDLLKWGGRQYKCFHPCWTSCCHCHHRHLDSTFAPGCSSSTRSSPSYAVFEQP